MIELYLQISLVNGQLDFYVSGVGPIVHHAIDNEFSEFANC